MRSMRTLIAIVTLVGMSQFATSVPAYADGYQLAKKHSGGHSGPCKFVRNNRAGISEYYFCSYGDLFHLYDLDQDGHSIGTKWRTSNGQRGLCRYAGGAPGAGDCNLEFPESATVTFSIGRCNVTASNDCRQWSDFVSKAGPYTASAGQ